MNLVFARSRVRCAALAWVMLLVAPSLSRCEEDAKQDPLASWADGKSKQAIADFVLRVTKEAGSDFVPIAERIAVFDNDGTLWCEQPLYSQAEFAFARIRELASSHPEWAQQQPYKGVIENDVQAMAGFSGRQVFELIAASHAGMTTDEFSAIVRDWLGSARHPKFQRPFPQLVFQPMLELLAYLRANGFKTYIVSGGDTDFMRTFAGKVYGVPPEQVIGTTLKTQFEFRNDKPVIMRLPEMEFVDDKEGKPLNIHKIIGRRPIAAFGNSDGDLQMLQWTTAGTGPRFALIVHHTDAEREYAYDRQSHIGRLDKALDEATAKNWTVVDMKQDWKTIFPEPAPK